MSKHLCSRFLSWWQYHKYIMHTYYMYLNHTTLLKRKSLSWHLQLTLCTFQPIMHNKTCLYNKKR